MRKSKYRIASKWISEPVTKVKKLLLCIKCHNKIWIERDKPWQCNKCGYQTEYQKRKQKELDEKRVVMNEQESCKENKDGFGDITGRT